MKRIKVFCMQKDEDDILTEWILYHAHLFGMNNLYIIDNHSGRQSKSILEKYKAQGLNVFERSDYAKKGDYLFEMIRETVNDHDIAIPLDMDEFIGVLDLNNVSKDNLLKFARQCLSFDSTFYLNQ